MEDSQLRRGRSWPGRAEVILISAVILLVWILHGLPVITLSLTHLKKVDGYSTLSYQEDKKTETYVLCAEPLIYSGQMCRNELQKRKRGTPTGDEDEVIYIPSHINQSEVERKADILARGLLLLNPSPECSEAFRDFLCLYMFSLCISGVEVRALQPECINVSSMICQKEWEIAIMHLGDDSVLPRCTELSNETIFQRNELFRGTEKGGMNCPRGFYFQDGSCHLGCGDLILTNGASATTLVETMAIILASVCIVCSTVAISLSCTILRHSMMSFPSFLILLQCLPDTILAIILLVGYADRKALFCGYKRSLLSINKNINEETTFCTVTGLFFIYCTMQWNALATTYSTATCWMEIQPKNYYKIRDKNRLQLFSALSCFLIFLLPLITSLGHLRYGFLIRHLPNFFCSPRDITYEFMTSLALPATTSAVTMTAMTLCLYRIIKDNVKKTEKTDSFLWLSLIAIHTVISGFTNLSYYSTVTKDTFSNHNTSCLKGSCESFLDEPLSVSNRVRLAFIAPFFLQPLIIMSVLVSLKVYRWQMKNSKRRCHHTNE